MKDVNREAVHVYRRDARTFLMQDTYAVAVNVLERLTHVETIGTPAVPLRLPATEYRLGYFICRPHRQGIRQVDVGSVQPDHVGRGPGAHRAEGPRRRDPAGPRSKCRRFAAANASTRTFRRTDRRVAWLTGLTLAAQADMDGELEPVRRRGHCRRLRPPAQCGSAPPLPGPTRGSPYPDASRPDGAAGLAPVAAAAGWIQKSSCHQTDTVHGDPRSGRDRTLSPQVKA